MYSSASKNNRFLLILDGHEYHKSMRAISFAKEHGVQGTLTKIRTVKNSDHIDSLIIPSLTI